MNAINRAATAVFDLLVKPLSFLGDELTIVVLSGIFGILALILFKFISYQKGIKSTKDKIKAGMIEIRLYQNDLGIVSKAVGKVLGRNFQYMALNFGPFIPLSIPFVLALAQLVCRFGFAPVPVWEEHRDWTPGKGTVIEIAMRPGEEALVSELEVVVPETLVVKQPLMRNAAAGKAWIEVVARASGNEQIEFVLPDGVRATKDIVTGDGPLPALMAPERVSGFWKSWLWPAEDNFQGTPFADIKFTYPERELRWMPDGVLGVLLTFLVASILFGLVILKPLGIQI